MLRRSGRILSSLLSPVSALFALVLLVGCAAETTFEWDVPEQPQRVDTVPFNGPEERGFSRVGRAQGTFNFPDGASYVFEAPIMHISIDQSSDDNEIFRDDLVQSIKFEHLTERADLVAELERQADVVGVQVDSAAVQEWIDSHDPEVDRSILIPVTGWRDDSYAIYLIVVDKPGDWEVSVEIIWTHTLGPFLRERGEDPNLSEEFDIEGSPYLLR